MRLLRRNATYIRTVSANIRNCGDAERGALGDRAFCALDVEGAHVEGERELVFGASILVGLGKNREAVENQFDVVCRRSHILSASSVHTHVPKNADTVSVATAISGEKGTHASEPLVMVESMEH